MKADISKVPVHPAAEAFPLISDGEIKQLAEDIKKNGQIHPIITWNGAIVDGRNRLAACALAGVEPRFEERSFANDNAVIDFVIGANDRRRHMNSSQRAVVASSLANMRRSDTLRQNKRKGTDAQDCASEERPISQEEAADKMDVSRRLVQDAAKVQKQAPELIPMIQKGDLTVSKASELADKPEAAKAVAAGTMTVKEATKKAPKEPEPKVDGGKLAIKIETLTKENAALQKAKEDLEARVEAMGGEMEELTIQVTQLEAVVKADKDKRLEAALAEIKKVSGKIVSIEKRNKGLMSEKAEAVSLLKLKDRALIRVQKDLDDLRRKHLKPSELKALGL